MPRTFLRAFGHAVQGISSGLRRGRNLRIQVACALAVPVVGGVLGLRLWEWCLAVICIALVLSAELFNSAIEALADEVTLEQRAGIGRAKDMAAGAVLTVSAGAALVALLIVGRRLLPGVLGL